MHSARDDVFLKDQCQYVVHDLLNRLRFNIGIKHGFPCINICWVPREVLKTEVEDRGF